MASWIKQIFLVGLIIRISSISKSFASSVDEIDINEFIQMEGNMVSHLQNYLTRERDRLNQLKPYLTDWKAWRNSNTGQESEYITIPQNLFHLFKMLTLDLNEMETIIIETVSDGSKILNETESPTEDHLKEIILPLINLQYQYDLIPEDIMNGTLMDLKLDTSLPIDSCYFIGKTCMEYNNYICATDWLSICLNLTSDFESLQKITKSLYTSHIFLNQKELAYEYALDYSENDYYDFSTQSTIFELGSELRQLTDTFKESFEVHRICRSEYARPSKPNLKCRYNHENSAFLKIAPLKEEELYDAPKVLLYRDVVYDAEIEFVKNATIENMQLALLAGYSTPKFSYRVTESTFLKTDLPPLAALEKRTEDIANFSINFSELWQVLNYSPGGFYAAHSDYLPPNMDNVLILGNRMTTMLFYFNDVTLGGETVFPNIRVSAKPTKGAALIWHNIHSDGSRNRWADHSACPVIIGEKWGFTKWVRALKNRQCLRSIHKSDLKIFKNMWKSQLGTKFQVNK